MFPVIKCNSSKITGNRVEYDGFHYREVPCCSMRSAKSKQLDVNTYIRLILYRLALPNFKNRHISRILRVKDLCYPQINMIGRWFAVTALYYSVLVFYQGSSVCLVAECATVINKVTLLFLELQEKLRNIVYFNIAFLISKYGRELGRALHLKEF